MKEEQFDNEQEQPVYQVAILIDEQHIADYIHASLLERGLIPTEEEAGILGEIVFDYLLAMGMIDEFEEYDKEDE